MAYAIYSGSRAGPSVEMRAFGLPEALGLLQLQASMRMLEDGWRVEVVDLCTGERVALAGRS